MKALLTQAGYRKSFLLGFYSGAIALICFTVIIAALG